MLLNMTLEQFADGLASNKPAPGGGAAAALSGVLGTSLMEMVVHLSLGRKELAEYYDLLAAAEKTLHAAHKELTGLVDQDAAAFTAVMDALRLPTESEQEEFNRTERLQSTLKHAANVPVHIARVCLEALEVGRNLLGKINEQAVSDLAVGALISHAGAAGALLNTTVNLPLIQDEQFVNAAQGEVLLLRTSADDLLQQIQTGVYKDETFAIMRA